MGRGRRSSRRRSPSSSSAVDLPAWRDGIARPPGRGLVGVLAAYGLATRPSDANWVLVDAPGLREALAPHGVVVRDCASFGLPGLTRIAVPDERGPGPPAPWARPRRRGPSPRPEALRVSWQRPVPLVGDTSSARARREAPRAWAFDDDERSAFYAAVAGSPRHPALPAGRPAARRAERILGAAHAAPSVGHSQPWRFVVVRDPHRATGPR